MMMSLNIGVERKIKREGGNPSCDRGWDILYSITSPANTL